MVPSLILGPDLGCRLTPNPNLRVCTENIPLPAHPCLALCRIGMNPQGLSGCALRTPLTPKHGPRSHTPQPSPLPLLRPQGTLTVLGGLHPLDTVPGVCFQPRMCKVRGTGNLPTEQPAPHRDQQQRFWGQVGVAGARPCPPPPPLQLSSPGFWLLPAI